MESMKRADKLDLIVKKIRRKKTECSKCVSHESIGLLNEK